MAKSCKGLAVELVKCLSESDCVKVEKKSFRECAKEKSPCIPSECVGLRETYFNCKRGQFHDWRDPRIYLSTPSGGTLMGSASKWHLDGIPMFLSFLNLIPSDSGCQ
ncbi:hypothetical protein KY285_017976 [Solanum tuberosum]|nr:hypothetical protein KY284_017963 [Solanum tuberosum]KAH0690774.1 hypothetical protein KY289_018132 [Solanum tuberosum]KAH0703698.1 hypothetical protein KY285_017976 [Solanum tuberosum]